MPSLNNVCAYFVQVEVLWSECFRCNVSVVLLLNTKHLQKVVRPASQRCAARTLHELSGSCCCCKLCASKELYRTDCLLDVSRSLIRCQQLSDLLYRLILELILHKLCYSRHANTILTSIYKWKQKSKTEAEALDGSESSR